MSICYLTGKTLRTKKKNIQEDDAESLEHIIPNALGGKLTSTHILSHRANQDLNDSIDKEFVKIFNSFCLCLDIQKDRKTTSSILATHKAYSAEVVFKGDRYYPKRPFFDTDKRVIYADSKKTGENYKTYLLKNGTISETEEIVILDDIAGEFDIPFSLNNAIFKKGLAKIAAGFASLHKVSRENLKDVIDRKNNTFQDVLIVAPSFPTSELEYEFEKEAGNSHHYPIHGLVLSGSKEDRFLYCHIELFSTFQFYVILDKDYSGDDIYHSYAYSITYGVDIDFFQYFSSLLTEDKSKILLKTYKLVSLDHLIKLMRAHADPNLKKYTHFKFNSLSVFSNYVFLRRKAEALGLSRPPEEIEL